MPSARLSWRRCRSCSSRSGVLGHTTGSRPSSEAARTHLIFHPSARLMRFADWAARAVDLMAIATFSGMFACVLGQVGFRYFLGDPLTWSDELARYLFVWCAFLGWIIAARRRTHLAIGSLPEPAGPRGQAFFALFAAAAAVVFAGVLTFYGTRIAVRNVDVDTTSLFFTMGVVYAIVPLAAIAVGLHALADGYAALRALRSPANSTQ